MGDACGGVIKRYLILSVANLALNIVAKNDVGTRSRLV